MAYNYHKINTIFQRDPSRKNIILENSFSEEIFRVLKDVKWEATEKVDGTNSNIVFNFSEDGTWTYQILGHKEASQLPKALTAVLNDTARNIDTTIFSKTDSEGKTTYPKSVTLHGEGYGAGIQGIGKHYRQDQGFILFDISIDTGSQVIWLQRDSVEDIAKKCNLQVVPIVGHYTLYEATELVSKGFSSSVSNEPLASEGVILRAPCGILDRMGKRIITKLKTCDFVKYRAKTGMDFDFSYLK